MSHSPRRSDQPNPDVRTPVDELHLDTATGVWAVRSESTTIYFVDADRRRLYRARGAGSGRGVCDDTWVALLSVAGPSDRAEGVVTVGCRHKWVMDPGQGFDEYQWWVQRECIAIEPVAGDAIPGQ